MILEMCWLAAILDNKPSKLTKEEKLKLEKDIIGTFKIIWLVMSTLGIIISILIFIRDFQVLLGTG